MKFKFILMDRTFLTLLLIINFLGTIYGYIWYEYQLVQTPLHLIPFVPDSPTASLFFVIVLIGLLLGKNYKLFEALAMLTLFKYGVWAVVMNILTYLETGNMSIPALMLIISHGAMAIQGLLYAPFYKIEWIHVIIASVWTLHNDVIDYVYGHMPIYGSLTKYMEHIGYFTFWLSLLSIWLVYRYGMRQRSKPSTKAI
ncbi:DUF1405 domain-containing protein [Filobacillus milosensis]|uniref:DUF1405 domain-containing protein n=1 Tax=Filobacillus milosensis TaxID=94137 RepID=A0A4Y8ITS1_9BACI|nr:DUF1405 domain-containing protein [Filobacillus milosensis]TFB24101.1 DUF1405 domain-containing protein [Filobacillus milosensis]